MKNKRNKGSITSKVKGFREKLSGVTRKHRKNVDCEKMKIESSEELNPDDFE